MRVVLGFLSFFLVLSGAWLALMENVLRHPGYGERTAFALCLVAQGMAAAVSITFARGPALRMILLVTAVAMLAAGVSAFSSAISSPHFEGYAVVIAGLIVLHSAALLAWTIPSIAARFRHAAQG